MAKQNAISHDVMKRLSMYLTHLKLRPTNGPANVTAEQLGKSVGLAAAQINADISQVGTENHPKIGYITEYLISDIEKALGYDNVDRAILVGVGHLGQALLSYQGFNHYGLDIVAAFDTNPELIGTEINGKKIFDAKQMKEICQDLGVRIGIITAPAKCAQSIAEEMVECNMLAIWNFAPTFLQVPEGILVENENIADSLVVLSRRLADKLILQEM